MAVRYFEGEKLRTAGVGIDPDKLQDKIIEVLLREENNLIHVTDDKELYTDLQIVSGATPTTDFEVGLTVGRVEEANGWLKTGTLIVAKTTSGDNIKILYSDDGKFYVDNGTGTFKLIYFASDVDALIQELRTYIEEVEAKITVFSGDEGIKYYIKVSTSEPEEDTPNNVITFVIDPDQDVDITKITITPDPIVFKTVGESYGMMFTFEPSDYTETVDWDSRASQLITDTEEHISVEKIDGGFTITCTSLPSTTQSYGGTLSSKKATGYWDISFNV